MGLVQDVRVEKIGKKELNFQKEDVSLSIDISKDSQNNFVDWIQTGEGEEKVDSNYLNSLDKCGFLEQEVISTIVPKSFLERHSRTLRYLAMYESREKTATKMLERLYCSRVVVVGNGGVGSWVVSNLLQSGIGTVVGIDADIVEISNLNRSAVFSPHDIGRSKCESISLYCKKYFPEQNYVGVEKFISSSEDLLSLLDNADFIVSAADKPHGKIREWVREAALESEVPLLETFGGGAGPIRAKYASSYDVGKVSGNESDYIPYDISRQRRGPSVPFFHPMADSLAITQAIFEEISGCKESILRYHRIQKSRDVSIGKLV